MEIIVSPEIEEAILEVTYWAKEVHWLAEEMKRVNAYDPEVVYDGRTREAKAKKYWDNRFMKAAKARNDAQEMLGFLVAKQAGAYSWMETAEKTNG